MKNTFWCKAILEFGHPGISSRDQVTWAPPSLFRGNCAEPADFPQCSILISYCRRKLNFLDKMYENEDCLPSYA